MWWVGVLCVKLYLLSQHCACCLPRQSFWPVTVMACGLSSPLGTHKCDEDLEGHKKLSTPGVTLGKPKQKENFVSIHPSFKCLSAFLYYPAWGK